MELKEYIKQSERTVSDKGFSMNMLHASWGIFTETGGLIDAFKKHLFYSKDIDSVNIKEEIGDICWYLAIVFREFKLNGFIKPIQIRSSHLSRYSNNVREMNFIQITIKLKKDLIDLSELLEYVFLGFEYDQEQIESLLLSSFDWLFTLNNKLELDFSEILQININKLAKRYPDKFDSNLALNRDLKAEREVLEGLNTKTEQVDYISELHNKGLFVDNSGIDSRVPKVVNDGM